MKEITNQASFNTVKEEFQQLNNNIGCEVVVAIISRDGISQKQGPLEFVKDFVSIGIGHGHQAMIGKMDAVKKVSLRDGTVLYENKGISFQNAPKPLDPKAKVSLLAFMNKQREEKYGTNQYNLIE